jgi:sugar phosphate isomerase/epimerase
MARPSLGTTIYIVSQDENSWDEEARSAREVGAEHITIHLEYPLGNGRLRERQLRRLRNLLKGKRLLLRAPSSWPSLITPHEGLYRLSLQELKETLALAPALGVELFILRGGAAPFQRGVEPIATGQLREGLRELGSLAREIGLTLAIENLSRGYPSRAGELEETLAFAPSPGLKLSLDLGQARAGGEEPVELLRQLTKTERLVRVALGPGEELRPLLAYLEGVAFLTLDFPPRGALPQPGRWSLIQEEILRLKAALEEWAEPTR